MISWHFFRAVRKKNIMSKKESLDNLLEEMKKNMIDDDDFEEELRKLEEEARNTERDEDALLKKTTSVRKKFERKTNRAALVEAMDFTLCRTKMGTKTKNIEFARFVIALKTLRKNCEKIDYVKALKALKLFVKNLVQHPDEPKYRSVRVQNKVFQKRLGVLNGGLECMCAIGFVKIKKNDDTEYLEIESTNNKSKALLKRVLVVLENAVKAAA